MVKKNILVVAAHPDDEVLGCGGTIIKYSQKYNVFSVIVGEGCVGSILAYTLLKYFFGLKLRGKSLMSPFGGTKLIIFCILSP